MNCVLPVLLVLLSLTFSNQDKSIAGSNDTITINDHTEKIPHTIDVQPEPDQQNSTTSSPIITTTSNGTNITTTAVTTTKSPNTTTVSPNSTSTTASSTTTTLVPTKPSTSSVTPSSSTKAPVSTSTASPEPGHHRSFDGPSFIGGIVLALGLVAIGFVAFKFYKARIEVNYHTL
ncbi:porimin-like [Diorhabda carinulata]|uniref:porimin-like n=1 Tax=Diorhabda carinulata TaxID=1163345 RepID=UPI0025A2AB2C|nr:porimin-like [Diorhabda carinulata]